MSMNVARHLDRLAVERPDAVALHWPKGKVQPEGHTPHHRLTFAELARQVDALAHGLKSVGVETGTRVALMIPPGPDFVITTFALFKLGAVPVMVDPGMGVKNVGRCLAEAEPTVFLGIGKAQVARTLFGWASKSLKQTIHVGQRRFFSQLCTGQLHGIGLAHGAFPTISRRSSSPAEVPAWPRAWCTRTVSSPPRSRC
jgi:olefin beta-lactone synthetase